MRPSMQKYYEGLVSKQPESVKRFLLKNRLMRYEKAFIWLDKSDKIFITNGFKKGIELRADYVFNKLCKKYRAQQHQEISEDPVNQRKNYFIEFKPLAVELQHSELLLLQEYCIASIRSLSRLSQNILLANGLYGIEQLFPYIKGEKRIAELLKSSPRRKTKDELYGLLKGIRRKVEEKSKIAQLETTDFPKKDKTQNVSIEEIDDFKLEPIGESPSLRNDTEDKMELSFAEWQNKLSVRSRNILETNGVTCHKDLKALFDKKFFSFKDLKGCGAKSAKELMEMANALIELEPQTTDNVDKEKINNLERKINSCHLTTRAKNFLKEANIETIGDLVSLNRDDVLRFKHIGRKTIFELDVFLEGLGLSFGMNLTGCSRENKANDVIDPILALFSNEARSFATFFKEKQGHLPMIFLLYERLNSLAEYEEMIFKLYYGIADASSFSYDKTNSDKNDYSIEGRSPLSIEEIAEKYCLTHERVRQILVKAQNRFVNAAKLLRNHRDWCYYGLDKNPLFVWNVDDNLRNLLSLEDSELKIYVRENSHTEPDVSFLNKKTIIDEYLLKILLIGCDMSLYWIDSERVEIRTGLSNKKIKPNEPKATNILMITGRLDSFKFNKAIKEVFRLYKVKTEDDILVPIKSCFVDNSDYWSSERKLADNEKNSLECLLTNLFKEICDAFVDNGNLFVKANKIDYGTFAYEILKIAGTRLHRDVLFTRLNKVCEEKGLSVLVDPLRFSLLLSKDSRIVTYGKSGFWGLKEWGEVTGSIRDIAVKMVRKSKEPIQIEDLANRILLHRPDSAFDNVTTIIRQSVYMGEFVLFFDDYIGLKGKKYDDKYVIYPTSFDEWVDTYRNYVQNNRHHPYCGQNGYEGYLYRWHYKASQLTDLSPDEIVKIDILDKELSHYPHNATENKFLHNCNLYKRFVEGNNRMLKESDDKDLFKWFYSASRDYSSYNDNRTKYFSQLLQYLSNKLY